MGYFIALLFKNTIWLLFMIKTVHRLLIREILNITKFLNLNLKACTIKSLLYSSITQYNNLHNPPSLIFFNTSLTVLWFAVNKFEHVWSICLVVCSTYIGPFSSPYFSSDLLISFIFAEAISWKIRRQCKLIWCNHYWKISNCLIYRGNT